MRILNTKTRSQGKQERVLYRPIDLEDNVWLAMFAPREDPEIALVIFLPNGYSDNVKAFPTAKAILQYYFDTKKSDEEATESTNPTEGTMLTS